MTHAAIQRFHTRRAIREQFATKPRQALPPTGTSVVSGGPTGLSSSGNDPRWNFEVTESEVERCLAELGELSDQRRTHALLDNCRREALRSLAVPFGLGSLVSVYDKVGGNVDTVHNARGGVYASGEAKSTYEDREVYDSQAYHSDQAYMEKGRANAEMLRKGTLKDDYTGETFSLSDKKNAQTKPVRDHVIAAVNIHNDAGRILAGVDGVELANRPANLVTTGASINAAKKQKDAEAFSNTLNDQSQPRRAEIAQLEAKASVMTDQERKHLVKLQEQEKVDQQRLVEAEAKAKKDIDRKINQAYYGSSRFIGDVALTSLTEGAKMGFQAAFGVVLVEFFVAAFEEMRAWFKHRSMGKLKQCLARIGEHCFGKLSQAISALKLGALSGFFSNLVTTLVNAFVTTSRRMVRLIREGVFSLFSAVKNVLFPPEGFTFNEAVHESSKILLSGVLVIGGLMAEEYVAKQLAFIPIIAHFADSISMGIVGAITAILTAFAVYVIDKADLFKVMEDRRNRDISAMLDESIAEHESRIIAMLEECW